MMDLGYSQDPLLIPKSCGGGSPGSNQWCWQYPLGLSRWKSLAQQHGLPRGTHLARHEKRYGWRRIVKILVFKRCPICQVDFQFEMQL